MYLILFYACLKFLKHFILAVAQLAEQLLPIPEVRGLNPVISRALYWIYTLGYCWNIDKRGREWPIKYFLFDNFFRGDVFDLKKNSTHVRARGKTCSKSDKCESKIHGKQSDILIRKGAKNVKIFSFEIKITSNDNT